MSFRSRLRALFFTPPATPARTVRRPRLHAEPLEDRSLLTATLSISDALVYEYHAGTSYATFTVRLSEPAAGAVTVNYATADGTARAKGDYLAAAGTLTFAAGETAKTITVAIKGDTQVEDDEYFFVNLSGATGAVIADGQGAGGIRNDDFRSGHHNPHEG